MQLELQKYKYKKPAGFGVQNDLKYMYAVLKWLSQRMSCGKWSASIIP